MEAGTSWKNLLEKKNLKENVPKYAIYKYFLHIFEHISTRENIIKYIYFSRHTCSNSCFSTKPIVN